MALYYNKTFPESTEEIPSDASFGILLDKTPFYAEAVGQEHDTGRIVIDGAAEFDVSDVQGFNGYVLHIGQMKYGSLTVGDEVLSTYDEVRKPSMKFGTELSQRLFAAPPLASPQ